MQIELIDVTPVPLADVINARGYVTLPARELFKHITEFGDAGYDETTEQLAERKLAECTGTFLDSIMETGIQAPIVVYVDDYSDGLILSNGHHRFFAAVELDLDVPVAFDTDHALWDHLPASFSYYNTWDNNALFDLRYDYSVHPPQPVYWVRL